MKVWSYSIEGGLRPIEVEGSPVEALKEETCIDRTSYASTYIYRDRYLVHLHVSEEMRFILVESLEDLVCFGAGGLMGSLIRSLIPSPTSPNVFYRE